VDDKEIFLTPGDAGKGERKMESVIIANAYSEHKPKQRAEIEFVQGSSSPRFAYVWIDDICYMLRKGARVYTLKKCENAYVEIEG